MADTRSELEPMAAAALAEMGLELVELEVGASKVVATVDCTGGVGMEQLATANRVLSELLDGNDRLAPAERYELEVSSPGIERLLRTPAQFRRAVGEEVAVRTRAGTPGDRRSQGRLASADEQGIVVGQATGGARRIDYGQIERARTVFTWGPAASGAGGNGGPEPGSRGRATSR